MPYCGVLFLGLSNMVVRILIVSGATCHCHFVAQCAIWVLEFERPENISFVVTHILGVAKF